MYGAWISQETNLTCLCMFSVCMETGHDNVCTWVCLKIWCLLKSSFYWFFWWFQFFIFFHFIFKTPRQDISQIWLGQQIVGEFVNACNLGFELMLHPPTFEPWVCQVEKNMIRKSWWIEQTNAKLSLMNAGDLFWWCSSQVCSVLSSIMCDQCCIGGFLIIVAQLDNLTEPFHRVTGPSQGDMAGAEYPWISIV